MQNRLPVLMFLAENDRIVDNHKVQQFMGHLFSGENRNRLVTCDSGHAIHFEMPEKVAGEIIRFLGEPPPLKR
jgi:esterase/lipase